MVAPRENVLANWAAEARDIQERAAALRRRIVRVHEEADGEPAEVRDVTRALSSVWRSAARARDALGAMRDAQKE